jgi:predicted metalloprotease with PDZ domain
MREVCAFALLVLAFFQVGCRSSAATADPTPDQPVAAGLTLDLTPLPDQGTLGVEVHVAGELASRVRQLAMPRRWADARGADAIGAVFVRDGRGEVATKTLPTGNDELRLQLASAPTGGDVTISYRVRAGARDSSRYGLRISREQLSAVGHTFLLLPQLDGPVPVHVRWHLENMAPGAAAACSLGSGDEVSRPATIDELSHAVYVAGKLDFVDGGESGFLAIVGPKSFEPSSTFLWTKNTMTLVRTALDPDAGPEAFSFFFVAEPGLSRSHDGAAFGRSFAIWFDASRSFDDALRIAVAHELTHRIFGTKVVLLDEGGGEAAWFSEGFAVHYARKILFAGKRISADAFLDDVKRSEDELAAVPDAWAHGDLPKSRTSYARGALYAASLDASLRRASHGQRSLDDVVQKLVATAEASGKPSLPAQALRELVVRELGTGGAEEFDHVIIQGEAPRVPNDAFGPCFDRVTKEVRSYELGFERASLERLPGFARGVVKGSAAEKAGLRDGTFVVAAKVPPGESRTTKVEISVSERKGARKIVYRPEARRSETSWQATQHCPR